MWVIDEVRLAVQKGIGFWRSMKCRNSHQIDPETREGGLFEGYIDNFLKLKAKTTGYPTWVGSPADEER